MSGVVPGHVVQRREAGDGILVHLDDPMGVAGRAPVVRVILDAGHGAAAVVVETSIGRGGREEVRDVEERGVGSHAAVDVDAEQRFVMDLRKEALLVLELKVRPQPRVQRLPKRAAFRVVVYAFRMQEARDAGLASDHPRLGDEALVQIRLLACEQWIVLLRIQVRLRRLGLLQLRQPRTPQVRMPREGVVAQRADVGRRVAAQHEQRVVVAENSAFLPLHLHPRRIPKHQIESSARPAVGPVPIEQIRKRQLPVMEPVPMRKPVDEPQPGELLEQPVEIQHPDLVADALRDVGGVLGVLLAEEIRGLVGTEVGLVDGAGQHQGDLVPEQPAVQRADGEAVGPRAAVRRRGRYRAALLPGGRLAGPSPGPPGEEVAAGPSKPSRISRNRVWMLWCR